MARCWRPSWIQRAPQLVQMAIGYRPKPMVTRADRHSGQRGIRATSVRSSGCGGYLTDGRRALGCRCTQLGVVSLLLAPSLLAVLAFLARTGRTWMRLGGASSALGTRIWSTPSSNEAWIPSAITWAGRVIERRKVP